MKKGIVITVIGILSVIVITLGALYAVNNTRKDDQIEALTEDVAVKASQIETLNTDIAYKNGQIDTLTADVNNKAAQIETLNADVADKTNQIEALTADTAEKSNLIDTLTTEVNEKAAQIEALNADVADKTNRIETLTVETTERANQIESLNADVSYKEGQIDMLMADVKDKAGQIDELNIEISKKAVQIETLKTDATKSAERIEILEAETKARVDRITELETAEKENEQLMAAARDRVSDLETENKELLGKIAEKDEYIAELTKKVNQYETDTASTAGTDTNQISVMPAKIKVSMDISPNKLSAPGKIYVVISLTNIGDEKTAGPVTLFYPDGAKISEFGSPVLAAGSRKTWQGEWRVTQKQLDAGKITFSVKYTSYDGEPDENGKPGLKTHKLNFSKIITYTKEKEKSESKSGYSQDAGNGQTTKTTSDPQVKTEGKTGEDSESKEE